MRITWIAILILLLGSADGQKEEALFLGTLVGGHVQWENGAPLPAMNIGGSVGHVFDSDWFISGRYQSHKFEVVNQFQFGIAAGHFFHSQDRRFLYPVRVTSKYTLISKMSGFGFGGSLGIFLRVRGNYIGFVSEGGIIWRRNRNPHPFIAPGLSIIKMP